MRKSRAIEVMAVALMGLTLGGSLGSVGPAGADTAQWADGAGDMWAQDRLTPAPDESEADIRKVSVRHGPQNVVIRVRYYRLEGGNFMDPIRGVVRTPDGSERRVKLSNDGDFSDVSVADPSRKVVRCRATGELDLDRYAALLTIPRSCLGEPRWVRVYLESSAWDVGGSGEIFADNAMGAAMPDPSHMVFTDRIYPDPPRLVASGL